MQEDEESERKAKETVPPKTGLPGGEGKEIVVGLSPFLIYLAPTNSCLDALGSLMDPYVRGSDVFIALFVTWWLAIESHACVAFQVATAHEVTFHCVGTESRYRLKMSPLLPCECAKEHQQYQINHTQK